MQLRRGARMAVERGIVGRKIRGRHCLASARRSAIYNRARLRLAKVNFVAPDFSTRCSVRGNRQLPDNFTTAQII